MASLDDKDRLDFFQSSKRGRVLRAMTLNDITYWGADAFIFVIYALYVVNNVEGGSATHVGISIFAYYFVRAILSIPVGQFFDKHLGHLDELYGLAFTSFMAGVVYISMSQVGELWFVYAAMITMGFVSAVNLTSWKVLFYGNVAKDEYGQTIGIYTTATSIIYALTAALGGVIGDFLGFDKVLLFGGIVAFVGGFIPLMIREHIKRK